MLPLNGKDLTWSVNEDSTLLGHFLIKLAMSGPIHILHIFVCIWILQWAIASQDCNSELCSVDSTLNGFLCLQDMQQIANNSYFNVLRFHTESPIFCIKLFCLFLRSTVHTTWWGLIQTFSYLLCFSKHVDEQISADFDVTKGFETSLGLILEWPFFAQPVGCFWAVALKQWRAEILIKLNWRMFWLLFYWILISLQMNIDSALGFYLSHARSDRFPFSGCFIRFVEIVQKKDWIIWE